MCRNTRLGLFANPWECGKIPSSIELEIGKNIIQRKFAMMTQSHDENLPRRLTFGTQTILPCI